MADVNVYDPATNAWTSLTPLPSPRHSPIVQYVDGKFCPNEASWRNAA